MPGEEEHTALHMDYLCCEEKQQWTKQAVEKNAILAWSCCYKGSKWQNIHGLEREHCAQHISNYIWGKLAEEL